MLYGSGLVSLFDDHGICNCRYKGRHYYLWLYIDNLPPKARSHQSVTQAFAEHCQCHKRYEMLSHLLAHCKRNKSDFYLNSNKEFYVFAYAGVWYRLQSDCCHIQPNDTLWSNWSKKERRNIKPIRCHYTVCRNLFIPLLDCIKSKR